VELVQAVANAGRGRGPRVGVLFGTHNPDSCAKVLDTLIDVGLATHEDDGTVKLDDLAAERVCIAQLYGEYERYVTSDRMRSRNLGRQKQQR
jgi:hypothetical protein